MDTEPVIHRDAIYGKVTHRLSTELENAHGREHPSIYHTQVKREIVSSRNRMHPRIVTDGADKSAEAKFLPNFKGK